MAGLCPECGRWHSESQACESTAPGSTVFGWRSSADSPTTPKPSTSGRSTPTGRTTPGPGLRLASNIFAAESEPTIKQQRLSGNYEDLLELDINDGDEEIHSDCGDGEDEDTEMIGASQYPDDADVDRTGAADGILFGFGYLPCEVTLPNAIPPREDLQLVEIIPGINHFFNIS